jgi:predicted nuclease of predicted toxin-antitoxin system
VSARLKVDEDLPRQIADLLIAGGHDAATVARQGWQGVPDHVLWPRVQDEGRWLITADKGFADLRVYPPGSHAGVILLRSQEESRRAYLELAAMALQRLQLDELGGAVVVVTYRGVRVRRGSLKHNHDPTKLGHKDS